MKCYHFYLKIMCCILLNYSPIKSMSHDEFLSALSKGNSEKVRSFLDENTTVVNDASLDINNEIFMCAIFSKKLECIKMVIRAGLKIDTHYASLVVSAVFGKDMVEAAKIIDYLSFIEIYQENRLKNNFQTTLTGVLIEKNSFLYLGLPICSIRATLKR